MPADVDIQSINIHRHSSLVFQTERTHILRMRTLPIFLHDIGRRQADLFPSQCDR